MYQTELGIAQRIEEDHALLQERISSVTSMMSQPAQLDEFGKWKLDFLWELRDFHNQLLKHFDLEEEGGLKEDVMHLAPQFTYRYEMLEEDHGKIVADLNHILQVVKDIEGPSSARFERVHERISDLIKVLKEHERDVDDLLQDVYCQEYGRGD